MTTQSLIARLASVKHAIREGYAWPGGYALRIVMSDGELLCRDCARAEWRNICDSTIRDVRDGWSAAGADVIWEGPDSFCAHCGKALPTEYGDPDA